MSTTYTAYTVIGVHLTKRQLTEPIAVRGCNCDVPDKATRFCPHCGKKMFVSKNLWRLKTTDDDRLTANIRLILPYNGSDNYFAGMVLSCDAPWSSADEKPCWDFKHWPADKVIQDLLVELQDLLKPLALWDEREFGIHTFVGTR